MTDLGLNIRTIFGFSAIWSDTFWD